MDVTEHERRALTSAQCLSLLPTVPLGRLVATEGALPAVVPVQFVLDPAGIVLRTGGGSAVAQVADGAVVALQADAVDTARLTGWSVTVVGQARTVRDRVELARLAALRWHPWGAGERSAYVVVEIGIVTGRRIGGPAVVADHA